MGITIRAGRPGFGKSYTATQDILALLRSGRRVYSNWPVVSQDKKYSSLVWEEWMVHEVIVDADVYIDEAYRDYDSTDRDSVDQDTHTFFATNRHNDVNGVLIAQNVARIAKKIREIAEYEYVQKVTIPYPLWLPYVLFIRWLMLHGVNPLHYDINHPPRLKNPRPLWFTIYTFESEEKAQKGNTSDAVGVERMLFTYDTAHAYDTHYFRSDDTDPYMSVPWLDYLEKKIPVPHRDLKDKLARPLPVAPMTESAVAAVGVTLRSKILKYWQSITSWLPLKSGIKFPDFIRKAYIKIRFMARRQP